MNSLILIGWLLLASDLVPILGLFSTTFSSMAITLIVFLSYKEKKENARIIKGVKWISPVFLLIGFIFFIFYLFYEVDYLLIIARPLNIMQPVPAIPFREKFGYLIGYIIFQTISIIIFVALLSQRKKVIWNVDISNQVLQRTFFHPFYTDNLSWNDSRIKLER